MPPSARHDAQHTGAPTLPGPRRTRSHLQLKITTPQRGERRRREGHPPHDRSVWGNGEAGAKCGVGASAPAGPPAIAYGHRHRASHPPVPLALDGLDGELVVVAGEAYVARADGSVSPVPGETRTPFAVVTPLAPDPPVQAEGLDHEALLAVLDAHSTMPVQAVRVSGRFSRLRVRSVPKQQAPYPPFEDVLTTQVEWQIGPVNATLVGFRFPSSPPALRCRVGTCTLWQTIGAPGGTC